MCIEQLLSSRLSHLGQPRPERGLQLERGLQGPAPVSASEQSPVFARRQAASEELASVGSAWVASTAGVARVKASMCDLPMKPAEVKVWIASDASSLVDVCAALALCSRSLPWLSARAERAPLRAVQLDSA